MRSVRTGLSLALVGAALVSSCSRGDTAAPTTVPSSPPPVPTSAPPPPPSPSPSPTSPLKSVPQAPTASYLTGVEGAKNGPVLVVKIDNTGAARPQSGIDQADVVYVEPVEHGLSRLAAVFSTRVPETIGPVRSARITDLELFAAYGRPAFVYSGAQGKLKPDIRRSNLVNLSANKAVWNPGPGYFRSTRRSPPVNLYANGPQMLRRAGKDVQPAKDVGFRFGPAPAGGTVTRYASASYAAARTSFSWSAAQGRWLASMDGGSTTAASGTRLGAATVVFQYVEMERSRFHDFTGANTPHARTVGSGRAVVLRDGKSWRGEWSRRKPGDGTVFTVGGQRMNFAPGPVWVVLVNQRSGVSVG